MPGVWLSAPWEWAVGWKHCGVKSLQCPSPLVPPFLPYLRNGLLIPHMVPGAAISPLLLSARIPGVVIVHSSGDFTSLGFLGLMQGVTEQLCSCVWLSLHRFGKS